MNHRIFLGPWTGSAPTFEVAAFNVIGLTYNLDSGDTLGFTMPMNSPATVDLGELETDIWLYEDTTLRQRFRVTNINAFWGESGEADLAVTCVSYKRLLTGRHFWADTSFAAVDQAEIIWQSIQHTQAQTNGDLGITAGTLDGDGILRDRTYVAGENILKTMTDLTGVIDGPLWQIAGDRVLTVTMPADFPTLATPLVRGVTARTLNRESGAAEFANAGMVDGDDDVTVPAFAASPTLATDPRGRWETVEGFPTVTQQDTLQEKADGVVEAAQSPVAQWSATIDPARYGQDFPIKPGTFVVVAFPPEEFTVVGLGNLVLCQTVSVSVNVTDSNDVSVSAQLVEIGPA